MKILVIEDERRIATYIKKGLENKANVVDIAFDGETGYDLASSEDYDAIILDRMLPKMDGIEICKKLRSEGNNTPVLLLTARTQVEERVEGLDAGADDYLNKPFAFTELVARVKALSRRPNNFTQTVLEVDNLTLNTTTYEVKRAGKLIELSKKEYTLLEFLMRNVGNVFNKYQLTEQVWPYDSDVLPNTAQVYIGYLRNKIDRCAKNEKQLIKTVRNFGYKIEG